MATPPSHTNAQQMNGTQDTLCLKSPIFFFLLLPRTWTTNEEQGLRRQHVLSLGMFLIYCFFKKNLLLLNNNLGINYLKGTMTTRTMNGTTQMTGEEREGTTGSAGAQVRHVMSQAPWYGMFSFFLFLLILYLLNIYLNLELLQ